MKLFPVVLGLVSLAPLIGSSAVNAFLGGFAGSLFRDAVWVRRLQKKDDELEQRIDTVEKR